MPCASCGLVDPSGRLSRSGSVCRHGFKRKILAFVEIAACAGELPSHTFCSISNRRNSNVLAPDRSSIIIHRHSARNLRAHRWIQTDSNRAPCLHNTRDCVRRPSLLPSCSRSRRRCTLPTEARPAAFDIYTFPTCRISLGAWGFLPAFACERGCSAMHVAACVAHACVPVAGGRAAAFTGVFQHHSPCVDHIFIRRAGRRDPLSLRCASPSLPCPAPALQALAEPATSSCAHG